MVWHKFHRTPNLKMVPWSGLSTCVWLKVALARKVVLVDVEELFYWNGHFAVEGGNRVGVYG